MTCKHVLILLLCIMPTLQLPAQTRVPLEVKETINPLIIGEKVPDLFIDSIFNFKEKRIRLSDLNGKLVILDFWATYCLSCVEVLPKMDTLQRAFNDKIQILTISNSDTRASVEKTFKRFKKMAGTVLPVATGNVYLKKYFPHELISHVVWIDGNGVVKAITGTDYITADNIRLMLSGAAVSWPVKNDIASFDFEKPFADFAGNSTAVRPSMFYYSAFSGYLKGIAPTASRTVDSVNNRLVLNYYNEPLVSLCKASITGEITGDWDLRDVILKVKDRGRYKLEEDIWNQKNAYCYSLAIPMNKSEDEIKKIVRKNLSDWLETALGISVQKERLPIKCLAISGKRPNLDAMQTKGGEVIIEHRNKDSVIFKNYPFSELVGFLNNQRGTGLPLILNRSNVPDTMIVDIMLPVKDLTNLASLRKALSKYGLDMEEIEVMRDMYIITEEIQK